MVHGPVMHPGLHYAYIPPPPRRGPLMCRWEMRTPAESQFTLRSFAVEDAGLGDAEASAALLKEGDQVEEVPSGDDSVPTPLGSRARSFEAEFK